MADYRGPKPVDPIGYRKSYWLCIRCACGRQEAMLLGDVARIFRIPDRTKLYVVIRRLRCKVCGQEPVGADVKERKPWRLPNLPIRGNAVTEDILAKLRDASEDDVSAALKRSYVALPITTTAEALEIFNRMLDHLTGRTCPDDQMAKP